MTKYELPHHIWSLIKKQICGSEILEVKNILGESLVDQTIELRQEVKLLLEIWDDMKERQLISTRLIEPSHIRELLIKEIKIFADGIKDKLKRDVSEFLNNDSVLRFVFNETSSNNNYRNNNNNEKFNSVRSKGLSGKQGLVDLSQMSLKDHNTDQFEDLLKRTRILMRNEIKQLEEDIGYIQECLESDNRMKVVPTMTDLKKTRSRLDEVDRKLTTNQNRLPLISNQSVRAFLLDCHDLFTSRPITDDDEGFRSPPPSLFSNVQAPITSFPFNSFNPNSLQPPTPFPVSNFWPGQQMLTDDPTEEEPVVSGRRFSTNCNSGHSDGSEVEQGRVNNNDDNDDYRLVEYNEIQPSSSSSSTATSNDASLASSSMTSSSSSSGVFSYSSPPTSSSSSSSSSFSSSSSSGRVSSLRRRIDMMRNYRRV